MNLETITPQGEYGKMCPSEIIGVKTDCYDLAFPDNGNKCPQGFYYDGEVYCLRLRD